MHVSSVRPQPSMHVSEYVVLLLQVVKYYCQYCCWSSQFGVGALAR